MKKSELKEIERLTKQLRELKAALKGMPSDNLREKQERDIGRGSELAVDEREVLRPKKRTRHRPQT